MSRRSFPKISRGEIWLVDWSPGRGSEQLGQRPALVVQNDYGNHAVGYPNTIVAAISSQGKDIPFHISLQKSKSSGLKNDSFVKCEQILTISKNRLIRKWGKIGADELAQVDIALKLSLELS